MRPDHITEFLKKPIEQLEYELVEVNISGSKNPTLQIMIERKDRNYISLRDCEKVSRSLSTLIDGRCYIGSIYIRNFFSRCRTKTK